MVNCHLGFFVLITFIVLVCGASKNLPILSFDEGYSQLFGDDHLMVVNDGKSVHLTLDERTGQVFKIVLLDFYEAVL